MVAYRTNAILATLTRREGYVSWRVYNLVLTPAHDWIHDCIRDCNQEWYSALNKSAVWTNISQGIISMLSGGTVDRSREPSRAKPRRKDKSGKNQVAPKGAIPVFPSFPIFFVPQLDSLLVFDGLNVFRPMGTINTGYACISPDTT